MFRKQLQQTNPGCLTWETLGVDRVSLPSLSLARKVADVRDRVEKVVPFVSEGQFIRIWCSEVVGQPREQSFEFIDCFFENHLVSELILEFSHGKRITFPFQGDWMGDIGQLNPVCSGELYIGQGTLHQTSSENNRFLFGRVMDGALYLREYNISRDSFAEARRGVAKINHDGALEVFSWGVGEKSPPFIHKKTCGLKKISFSVAVDRISSLCSDHEIEFVKDSPVEFVLAERGVLMSEATPYRPSEKLQVYTAVQGNHAKSFSPTKGCIFPLGDLGKRMTWKEMTNFRIRIPIIVGREVYIVNDEYAQAAKQRYDDYFCEDPMHSVDFEASFRVQLKASYSKENLSQSTCLTKKMQSIFHRAKISPKLQKVQSDDGKIRKNLKLLALETGNESAFVDRLTTLFKITDERAREIYDSLGVRENRRSVHASKGERVPRNLCSVWTNDFCPRKKRKTRKTKANALKKGRNLERRKKQRQQTRSRKIAREVKMEKLLDLQAENLVWSCCGCYCGCEYGWEDYWSDEEDETCQSQIVSLETMHDWLNAKQSNDTETATTSIEKEHEDGPNECDQQSECAT